MLCEWSTASETNNAYFDVEVSRGNEDGLSFKAIGRVLVAEPPQRRIIINGWMKPGDRHQLLPVTPGRL